MKKVLITGAAGTLGLQVLRFLLSEGKYEISVLELKNKHVYRRLKKFRKRINIIYGDINDEAIVDALVKDHDVVIHLAAVLPPFANVRADLSEIINYQGTVNIVNSIKSYNPKCYLLYASSTSVYGKVAEEKITVRTKGEINEFDYYSQNLLKAEKYIKENISNYTIFRLAYLLCDVKHETAIYNVPIDLKIEAVSAEDAGYAFVVAIDKKRELNKKTYNLSGGPKYSIYFCDYLIKVLNTYGLSMRFLATFLLSEKNYYGGFYEDGDKLNDILNFRSKDIELYYDILDIYKGKISRFIPRLLARPFVWYFKGHKRRMK